ncbi:CARDB domain-containing protein [Natronosalvus amylolyticus]|uniref:CARDB domain-containing protein n=1 Tax=Natronosalvus amylolyticus TaxID=2961994 RepID=UPI0020C9EF70|nr:CARDB domain-containing protein [Natronosalvus amylolyticus]
MIGVDLSRRDVLRSGLLGTVGAASGVIGTATGTESAGSTGMDVTLIPADGDFGFNYPYYLYAPAVEDAFDRPILVEPNNTGRSTNNFDAHRESAERLIEHGTPRRIGDELRVPVLVPVFPRPSSSPVDWQHYVHALDAETMQIDSGDLERVDEQLLRMVEHARERLSERSYPVGEDMIMNGFSASGTFVNRFTALHPDRVRSVTAGGINGTATLPLEEAAGRTVDFPIGIADLESLTGEAFDRDQWQAVDQLVYMGGDDENDTIPYDDAWNSGQREIALEVYGEHMQNDRMPYCKSVYEEAGATGRVEVYPNIGHRPVTEELIAFHRKHVVPQFVGFAEPPAIGEETVTVLARAQDTQAYELRVFSDERGELTDAVREFDPAVDDHVQVQLATPLADGEDVTVGLFEPGSANQGAALASETATVHGKVAFVETPVAGDETVTIAYDLSTVYPVREQATLRLDTEQGGASELTALEPGTNETVTLPLEADEHGVPLEQGREVTATIVDADPQGLDPVATDTRTIGAPAEPALSIDVDVERAVLAGEAVTVEIAVRVIGGDSDDLTDLPIECAVEGDVVDTVTVSPSVGETETIALSVPTDGYDRDELTVSATWGETTDEETVILATQPANGDGSAGDPYRITDGTELAYVDFDLSAHFELAEDIDLSGFERFVRIGSLREPFSGTFDGRQHEITGVHIEESVDQFEGIGLFGNLIGGSIENVHLVDVHVTGDDFVGGAVGMAQAPAEISRVTVSGTVVGGDNVGGIIGGTSTGEDGEDVVISETASDASVQGERKVGGIMGQSSGDRITNSYASGSVSGHRDVAGVLGLNVFGGVVSTSYASATLEGDGGGLVANNPEGSVTDSYWDVDATGISISDGGATGLRTEEMTGDDVVTTLSGFDFEETWAVTDEYPVLAWEHAFSIQQLSELDTHVVGEPVEVTVTVANTGPTAIEETLEFRFAGEVVERRPISLDADESTTLEFEADTDGLERGVHEYGVAHRTASVTLIDADSPVFELTDVAFLESVEKDTEPSLSVTIRNLGVADEQAVVVRVTDDSGDTVLSDRLIEASLESGEYLERTFFLDTAELSIGEYELTVETDDDDYTRTFEVQDTSDDDAETSYDDSVTRPDDSVTQDDDSGSRDVSEADDQTGFGFGSALAGIAGVGYLLKRRMSSATDQENES